MKFSLFISLIVEWTYKQKQTYYVFKIRTYVRHEKKFFTSYIFAFLGKKKFLAAVNELSHRYRQTPTNLS